MFRCSNQHFNFKMMKTEDLYLLFIVMMHHDFKWWWWYSHIPRHEKRQEKNTYPYPGTFLRSKWSTCNEYHGIIWKVSTWSFQYLNNSPRSPETDNQFVSTLFDECIKVSTTRNAHSYTVGKLCYKNGLGRPALFYLRGNGYIYTHYIAALKNNPITRL